jgi:hypothetical protein
LRGQLGDTRREFLVPFEDLRADHRLLAEGIAAVDGNVDDKIEGLRSEMRAEFQEVRALLELSYSDLDRRASRLEEQ